MDVLRKSIRAALTCRRGVGLRTPSPAEAEAEEADKEILSEVFRVVYHDEVSLDDALQSVAREDLFCVKLTPTPKPAKLPPPETEGGRRPKGGKEQPEPRKKYKKRNCFAFPRRQVPELGHKQQPTSNSPVDKAAISSCSPHPHTHRRAADNQRKMREAG